jgi:hypothetical protein
MSAKKTPQEMFDIFNRRYFRGHLPPCKVQWMSSPKIPGIPFDCAGCCTGYRIDDGPVTEGVIRLWRKFKPYRWIWNLLLLHEMVHWKLRNNPTNGFDCKNVHGHAFQREMKRLAAIGALNGVW